MNIAHFKDTLLLFVSQWAGTTVPRLTAAFVGLLLAVLCIQTLWHRRLRLVPAMAGMGVGAGLVAMAVDTRVLHWLAGLDNNARLRLSVGLLSVMVLGATFEAIRRMRLLERYALLWMGAGALTLLGAVFPRTLDFVGTVFGTDYTASILAVLFLSVALVLFQFSLALSRSDHRESRLAQRCALLEDRLGRLERRLDDSDAATAPPGANGKTPLESAPSSPLPSASPAQPSQPAQPTLRLGTMSGAHLAAVVVIVLSGAWVLWTGWRTPEPMVGDEVTHFYMLKNQARRFPAPTFVSEIPVGWDARPEIRGYPHVSGWHYLGAVVYRLSGESFLAVQAWHTFFWVQLLSVGYLLALRRGGRGSRAPFLYLIVLASLPAAVMFSVLFYQDVPMAAQTLTAFYLVARGRRWWAMLFLLFAMALKETAFLFVPAFFGLWAWTILREGVPAGTPGWRTLRTAAVSVALAGVLVAMYSLGWAVVLQRYAGSNFYPTTSVQKTWRAWKQRAAMGQNDAKPGTEGGPAAGAAAGPALIVTPYETQIIANHPGDLRIPKNYILFGGVLLWIVSAVGLLARAGGFLRRRPTESPFTGWLWVVGLSYVVPAAYILRTAPDARFFLPAIPFLLLPLAEWAVHLPRIKIWLAVVSVLALMQLGAVHAKVYRLRVVSPALREAIAYLRSDPPVPRTVFMYPEGNYRLFPTPHDWYLNYHLREFWRGDNDARISMLNKYRIGAIVVKKHLIATVDEKITDLGVYPTSFVKDIERDPRFTRTFDNSEVSIYRVPAPD